MMRKTGWTRRYVLVVSAMAMFAGFVQCGGADDVSFCEAPAECGFSEWEVESCERVVDQQREAASRYDCEDDYDLLVDCYHAYLLEHPAACDAHEMGPPGSQSHAPDGTEDPVDHRAQTVCPAEYEGYRECMPAPSRGCSSSRSNGIRFGA